LLLLVFIIFFVPEKTPPPSPLSEKIFIVACFLFLFTYAFLCFITLYKNVWKRKSEIKTIQVQNVLINNWTSYMFVCIIVLALNRLISWIFLDGMSIHIWITALLWVTIFIKIILRPEILYGFNLLTDSIDKGTKNIGLKPLWNVEKAIVPSNNDKDQKLAEKIKPLLTAYVNKINELSFNSANFRNAEITLEDLASTLGLPASHVTFAFKYHCTETFADYKKVVRIHDACKLLDEGYLEKNTIESLAKLIGFTSYHTFYIAFKSITGTTTQDYVKRM
jgi:AraC-like DNA-binding protein